MRLFRAAWVASLSIASLTTCLAACGGDEGASTEGGSGQAAGAAPTISGLTFTPDTIPVGVATAVTIRFDYEDAEGDAKAIRIALTQDGVQPSESTVPMDDAAGVKAGPTGVVLTLTPPLAGELAFSITVLDEAGHASNALTGALQVVVEGGATSSVSSSNVSVSSSDVSASSSTSSVSTSSSSVATGAGGSGGAGAATGSGGAGASG